MKAIAKVGAAKEKSIIVHGYEPLSVHQSWGKRFNLYGTGNEENEGNSCCL